jgi:hypothetical protein
MDKEDIAKVVASIIWTAVVIFVSLGVVTGCTKDQVYQGTVIQFKTGRDLQIEAEKVTLEFASNDFFLLRKQSGEVIYGVPARPPLDWTDNTYYVYGPSEVPGGRWLFPVGSGEVKIVSDKPIEVRAIDADPASTQFSVGFVAFFVWILILAFILGL